MLKYQILVTLTEADTDILYTEFKQDVFDSYNADFFENVVEQFNELIAFVKKHYDCDETYDISGYILNEKNEAIY